MNAPRFNAAAETRGITITVTDKVYLGLVDMAREHSRTPSMQAQLLFEAAYSARCKPTGDRALDAAVIAMDRPRRETKTTSVVPAEIRADLTPGVPGVLVGIAALSGGVAAAVGGGVAEIDPVPAPEPAEAHDEQLPDGAPAEEPFSHPSASPTEQAAAEPPAVAESAIAAADSALPPSAADGGDSAPAPVETPAPAADAEPATAPVTVIPAAAALAGVSQGTIRYLRSLKACGNSAAEIAQVTGLPVDTVKVALGAR